VRYRIQEKGRMMNKRIVPGFGDRVFIQEVLEVGALWDIGHRKRNDRCVVHYIQIYFAVLCMMMIITLALSRGHQLHYHPISKSLLN